MFEDSTIHAKEILDCATKLLSQHFHKPIHLARVSQLSETDRRNLILRLELNHPTDIIPKTVILKQTAKEPRGETEKEQLSRFAHDWAGIEFLTKIGSDHAPHFFAGDIDHKFIIIEDLGETHSSLVDSLTRGYSPGNLQFAHQSLESYIERIGRMHADTAGKYDVFSKILQSIYPEASRYHFYYDTDLEHVSNLFNTLIGVESADLRREINDINIFAKSLSDFSVLLHGDICPDNVFYRDNELKIIDFEFADYGNALIDGVYLRMCMPSCWCSKAVPANTLQNLEHIYREALKTKIQLADDEKSYEKQVTYACAYWVMRSIISIDQLKLLDQEWICPSGPVNNDSKWEPDKNAFRPRILSRLNTFVNYASRMGHLPLLTSNTKMLLGYLQKAWPDTKYIDLFPVFCID